MPQLEQLNYYHSGMAHKICNSLRYQQQQLVTMTYTAARPSLTLQETLQTSEALSNFIAKCNDPCSKAWKQVRPAA